MINNKIKILIVEDIKLESLLLKINLERFNIENIMETDNGKSAIEIYQNNPDIDLILMNIQMPIMYGTVATQEIRKFDKDIIIIAHTAYAHPNEIEQIMNYGFNDYITKPILLDDLYNIIEKYFYI